MYEIYNFDIHAVSNILIHPQFFRSHLSKKKIYFIHIILYFSGIFFWNVCLIIFSLYHENNENDLLILSLISLAIYNNYKLNKNHRKEIKIMFKSEIYKKY